ncbi:DMT family transporter [Haloarculaceae archaeon H-GB2-1]|nr:DMT family transporter [Haloarculaceae archaeon H-GB11]MEA5407117.1 DMT family transporter [Haloarculaceae archaeon H-GB2-1]
MVLGFAGTVVIADPSFEAVLTSRLLGIALVFGASVSIALGSVLTRRLETDLDLLPMQAWVMLVGAVLLHAASAVVEPAPSVSVTPRAVGAVLYLALVASVGGFLAYFVLLEEIGAIESNLLDYVIPVFATASGWLVLGETVSPTSLVGFALILLGFGLLKGRPLLRALSRAGSGTSSESR